MGQYLMNTVAVKNEKKFTHLSLHKTDKLVSVKIDPLHTESIVNKAKQN